MAHSRIFVPTDSTEYISVQVIGLENGLSINLTSVPVEIAIRPVESGPIVPPVIFYTAEWELVNGVYYARILLGPEPGGLYLTIDTYNIWVKVHATPQLLIRKSPTILEIRPAETL